MEDLPFFFRSTCSSVDVPGGSVKNSGSSVDDPVNSVEETVSSLEVSLVLY